ncbi:lysozyme [Salmonella enterica]|nr:lysozyme [Salmonella enterica subsp. enterica]EKY7109946.1 lysozyme [Salmonella enterica]
MEISINGINLIKRFEELKLRAYKCPADIWTIGYGHTTGIEPDDVITEEQAILLLRQDIAKSERVVNQCVHVPLTQNQFDALTSFVFNLGVRRFRTSTLLKKLNAGDYDGASREFGRWVNVGSKILPGLIRRREAERMLFLK